ncbi:hypothetical protein C8Q74DRAFT_492392 [Fomes fomentarius]|nr:hypothetical protein C8Q74DRAFT_492392 [Fomes fomentarius]
METTIDIGTTNRMSLLAPRVPCLVSRNPPSSVDAARGSCSFALAVTCAITVRVGWTAQWHARPMTGPVAPRVASLPTFPLIVLAATTVLSPVPFALALFASLAGRFVPNIRRS